MQPPTLADVVAIIEHLYPPNTAQSWDQVGLVTGDPSQPVRHIHCALDPTLAVIEEARSVGADLLLTHHPLLKRGVHSVATTTAKGASVTTLVIADIALYVAHTNADVAAHEVLHMTWRAAIDQDDLLPTQQITIGDPHRDAMKMKSQPLHRCLSTCDGSNFR